MERLTIRNSDGTVSQPLNLRWADALERLAAYEDTGMEPQQIKNAQETLACFDNIGIKRGNEIVAAEEDGRLIVLPCKPGSIVRYKDNLTDKSRVDAITIYADGHMTFSFHEYGVKQTFVDKWSEDKIEKYVPCKNIKAELVGR